jgi:hypothetical protein
MGRLTRLREWTSKLGALEGAMRFGGTRSLELIFDN